jgi:hypothetical protein
LPPPPSSKGNPNNPVKINPASFSTTQNQTQSKVQSSNALNDDLLLLDIGGASGGPATSFQYALFFLHVLSKMFLTNNFFSCFAKDQQKHRSNQISARTFWTSKPQRPRPIQHTNAAFLNKFKQTFYS